MGYIYVETDVPWQRGGAQGAAWPDAMPPWFLADWRDAYGVVWQGVVEVAGDDYPRSNSGNGRSGLSIIPIVSIRRDSTCESYRGGSCYSTVTNNISL